MAQERYTGIGFDVRGQRTLQSMEVTIDRDTNAIEQHTLALGLAGFSPGVPKMTVQVTNGIPSAGIEYDPGADMRALTPVPFTAHIDGQFMTFKGTVIKDSTKKGTDSAATLAFTVVADLADWQRA